MAYYFGDEDKDQNQNNAGTNVQTSKDSTVIANGPMGASAAAPVANATANNAKSNPGNFVGISQYLDANKPQSADLANKVGGVITNAADTARTELGTKVADTENQIKSNTVGYDKNVINQLNQDASKADVAKIEAMKNAAYKGPNSLGNIDSLAAAQQASANADTEEGRRSLIGSLYKDQPLKQAALTFDNLLLQAAPEAKNALASAQATADVAGLGTSAAAEKARLEAAAAKAKSTTAQTAADTQKAINQARSGFETGLQSRVDTTRQNAITEAQGALERLQSGGGLTGQASDRDLALLGINQDQYQKILASGQPNLALSGSIRDASGINAANVASAEDYARYNVLKRLAGGGDFLGDDASQAGKYNNDLLDFNYAEPIVASLAPAPQTPPPIVAANNFPTKVQQDENAVADAIKSTNGTVDKVAIGLAKGFKKLKKFI